MQFGPFYSNLNHSSKSFEPRIYELYLSSYLNPPASSYSNFLSPEPSESYIDHSLLGDHPKPSSLHDILTGEPQSSLVPSPPPDPLAEFMAVKKRFLASSIEDVLGLIDERRKLKEDNLYHIDYDTCRSITRLYHLDHWQTGLSSSVDKIRTTIHSELVAFEREKRMEEVAAWRDMTRLRGELREIIGEYVMEKRKDGLFGGAK